MGRPGLFCLSGPTGPSIVSSGRVSLHFKVRTGSRAATHELGRHAVTPQAGGTQPATTGATSMITLGDESSRCPTPRGRHSQHVSDVSWGFVLRLQRTQ